MADAAARPSYTLALFEGEGLRIVTKDTDGNLLDDFTLHYTTTVFPVPEYNFRI